MINMIFSIPFNSFKELSKTEERIMLWKHYDEENLFILFLLDSTGTFKTSINIIEIIKNYCKQIEREYSIEKKDEAINDFKKTHILSRTHTFEFLDDEELYTNKEKPNQQENPIDSNEFVILDEDTNKLYLNDKEIGGVI